MILDVIAKIDSKVLRQLGVAGIGLVASILGAFHVPDKFFVETATNILDNVGFVIIAWGLFSAAKARVTLPNPPLSFTAITKRQELVASGKLTEIEHPAQSIKAPEAVKAAAHAAGMTDTDPKTPPPSTDAKVG